MINPIFESLRVKIWHGDNLLVMADMESNSVDSIVTDPPAAIDFMGKKWDSNKGGREKWIAWLVSVMRECLRVIKPGGYALVWALPRTSHWTGMALEDSGFEIRDRITHISSSTFAIGNRLKPNAEDWWLCRKHILEKNIVENVIKYGTGNLNIIESKTGTEERFNHAAGNPTDRNTNAFGAIPNPHGYTGATTIGRWPSNVVLSHNDKCDDSHCVDDCVTFLLDKQSIDDVSRFFYCAKASSVERRDSNHPTIKPLALMRYLCKLITPTDGIILDHF